MAQVIDAWSGNQETEAGRNGTSEFVMIPYKDQKDTYILGGIDDVIANVRMPGMSGWSVRCPESTTIVPTTFQRASFKPCAPQVNAFTLAKLTERYRTLSTAARPLSEWLEFAMQSYGAGDASYCPLVEWFNGTPPRVARASPRRASRVTRAPPRVARASSCHARSTPCGSLRHQEAVRRVPRVQVAAQALAQDPFADVGCGER